MKVTINDTKDSITITDLTISEAIVIQIAVNKVANMASDYPDLKTPERTLRELSMNIDHILRKPKPSPDDQPQSAHLFNQRNQIY